MTQIKLILNSSSEEACDSDILIVSNEQQYATNQYHIDSGIGCSAVLLSRV